MPYLGIGRREVRRRALAAARATTPTDLAELEQVARTLWDDAEFREERYAAIDLTGLPLAKGRLELLPLHEHLAVTGAWWDYVDEIAHRIADLHDARPAETAAVVLRWSRAGDMWLRRLAILSQLGRHERLDTRLLAEAIDANVGDSEFFIRKAIGWALREYARVDPTWVREFVAAREDGLSALSKREALKHVG
jgi:3-methyladenine DNA glycosylase AlkD